MGGCGWCLVLGSSPAAHERHRLPRQVLRLRADEGFTYAPSDSLYWQHGHSTERDFVHVTTANLTHAQLEQLSDDVGPDRTLLVLCTAFRGKAERYSNLTVKKIPKQVLTRCEWGHDDYSLQVEDLPKAPPKAGQQDLDL